MLVEEEEDIEEGGGKEVRALKRIKRQKVRTLIDIVSSKRT